MAEIARDTAWFEAMYRRTAAPVLAYTQRRLRTPQDCEDVLVEVFATAWRRRRDMPADELPWLYATAANVIAHAARSSARRTRLDARLATYEPVVTPDIDEQTIGAVDARTALNEALQTLSEPDRDVLQLWAWEGLEGNELATALGVNAGAARTRLHRAKTTLRTAMTTTSIQGGTG